MNLAVVLFDDLACDGQTQAGATLLGRIERLKYLFQVFGGYAAAAVAEDDADMSCPCLARF